MLLTPSDAKVVTDRLLARSKADHCIVRVNGGERTNLRFARGSATTNGDQSLARHHEIAFRPAPAPASE
jgi:hypothetical protein